MSLVTTLKAAATKRKTSMLASIVALVLSVYHLGTKASDAWGLELGDPLAEQPDTLTGRVKQSATVIAAVTIGVIAIVGILIFDQVYTTMPDPSNSELSNSSDSVASGFGSAMELVPIILIVLMAVVVIGAVQRLR